MNIVKMTDAPYKYPSLTGGMLFRLWNAAIKDDDTLADEMIRGMYHCMLTFDRERAEYAMDLDRETRSNSKRHIAGFARGYAKISGLNEVAPTQGLNPRQRASASLAFSQPIATDEYAVACLQIASNLLRTGRSGRRTGLCAGKRPDPIP
jgi:hypothetical protein